MNQEEMLISLMRMMISQSKPVDLKEVAQQTNTQFAMDLAKAMMETQEFIAENDRIKAEKKKQESVNLPIEVEQKNQITNVHRSIYSEEWIVMQNRLLHAISHLTLNERRLILFLSPIVRMGSKYTTKNNREIFIVNVLDFAKEYNIGSKSAYRTLELVADSILQKAFFYWDFSQNEKGNKVGVSWFVRCEYKEKLGCLEIVLADEVIEMLTVFDKTNPFTKYQKEWITKLGTYGIVLIELVLSCMHQQYKQKSYTVEYLREKFDCVNSYVQFSDFKRHVINNAIKEIHKHTPIRIEYQEKKRGRAVSEINFSFKDITPSVEVENNQKNGIDIPKTQKVPTKTPKFTESELAIINAKADQYLEQRQITDETYRQNIYKKAQKEQWGLAEYRNEQEKKQQQMINKAKKTELISNIEQDIAKLKINAKRFVYANQHMVTSTGERMALEKGDYEMLIGLWRNLLEDPVERDKFNLKGFLD